MGYTMISHSGDGWDLRLVVSKKILPEETKQNKQTNENNRSE